MEQPRGTVVRAVPAIEFGSACAELNILPVTVWVSSGCSGFLLCYKDFLVG